MVCLRDVGFSHRREVKGFEALMRVLIVGILVLAVAVAGIATYLIQRFSGEVNIEKLQKEAEIKKIRVLVASKDLATGATLTEASMAWQVWVDEALNKQYVAVDEEELQGERIKEFIGGVVRRPMFEGEPILASKVFKRDKPGFMAGMLDAGKRAMSVSVTARTGAAGFILPGDEVDILLTHDKAREVLQKMGPRDPNAPLIVLSFTTETILRNVPVLAVDQKIEDFENKAEVVKTVTLELSPKQSEILTTARAMGKLSLVLRSLEGVRDRESPGTYTTDVEVSPFLSRINTELEKRRSALEKKRAEAAARKAKGEAAARTAEEEAARRAELEAARKAGEKAATRTAGEETARRAELEAARLAGKKPVEAPPPRVVKIYRGGAKTTEEITIK